MAMATPARETSSSNLVAASGSSGPVNLEEHAAPPFSSSPVSPRKGLGSLVNLAGFVGLGSLVGTDPPTPSLQRPSPRPTASSPEPPAPSAPLPPPPPTAQPALPPARQKRTSQGSGAGVAEQDGEHGSGTATPGGTGPLGGVVVQLERFSDILLSLGGAAVGGGGGQSHTSTAGPSPVASGNLAASRHHTQGGSGGGQGAAKGRTQELVRWFDLPDNAVLLDEFHCALRKRVLLQGRMFVFDDYMCFYSNVFGYVKKKVTAFRDVVAVRNKTHFRLPNSIEVELQDGTKEFYTSFLSRDDAYRLLAAHSKLATTNSSDGSANNGVMGGRSDGRGHRRGGSVNYYVGERDVAGRGVGFEGGTGIHELPPGSFRPLSSSGGTAGGPLQVPDALRRHSSGHAGVPRTPAPSAGATPPCTARPSPTLASNPLFSGGGATSGGGSGAGLLPMALTWPSGRPPGAAGGGNGGGGGGGGGGGKPPPVSPRPPPYKQRSGPHSSNVSMDDAEYGEDQDEDGDVRMWVAESSAAPPVPKECRPVISAVLPGTPHDFFLAALSDNTSFLEDFLESQGNRRINLSPWKRHESVGHVRDLNFVFPIKGAFGHWGVPHTQCHQSQRFCLYQGTTFVFESSQTMMDIPYGDCFTVEVVYYVTPQPDKLEDIAPDGTPRVQLNVHVRVPFSKRTMFKKIIESGTFKQVQDTYTAFVAQLRPVLTQRQAAADDGHIHIPGHLDLAIPENDSATNSPQQHDGSAGSLAGAGSVGGGGNGGLNSLTHHLAGAVSGGSVAGGPGGEGGTLESLGGWVGGAGGIGSSRHSSPLGRRLSSPRQQPHNPSVRTAMDRMRGHLTQPPRQDGTFPSSSVHCRFGVLAGVAEVVSELADSTVGGVLNGISSLNEVFNAPGVGTAAAAGGGQVITVAQHPRWLPLAVAMLFCMQLFVCVWLFMGGGAQRQGPPPLVGEQYWQHRVQVLHGELGSLQGRLELVAREMTSALAHISVGAGAGGGGGGGGGGGSDGLKVDL